MTLREQFARLRRIRCSPSERGDTLIEVLLALVIISLSAVALLGGLATTLSSSGEHRSLADIDTVLKSYAENAKYDIELQQPSPLYAPCASVTASMYNGQAISQPSIPAGWSSPNIVGIQFWNDATGMFDSPSTCQPNDYQLLTLRATAPNGVSQMLTIGLRNPS
jgi:prepilin-type N-terminal cleavage/methylation domain-containing protein